MTAPTPEGARAPESPGTVGYVNLYRDEHGLRVGQNDLYETFAEAMESSAAEFTDEFVGTYAVRPVVPAPIPTTPADPTGVSGEEAVRLDLADLHAANIARQAEWCPDQVPDLSFRGNELGGECGEAQNVIKKLERERLGWRGSRATLDDLGQELADVVICADLCAITAGIDLAAAVRAKFNATSEKVGLATMLRSAALPPPTADTGDETASLRAALTKIDAIRNSIIGLQALNWSEHVYPLVAALEEAGFEGMDYPEARENYGTMLERTNAAEAECGRYRQRYGDLPTASTGGGGGVAERACTCHPSDNPPQPCPQRFALSECLSAGGVPDGFVLAPREPSKDDQQRFLRLHMGYGYAAMLEAMAEAAPPPAAETDGFDLGQPVEKVGGDYTFAGNIVAAFDKLSGARRYVVEDDRGVLHVYSAKNLRLATSPEGR